MKKTVLMGAGQIGAMTARLLSGEYEPICFADNFEKKHGTVLSGLTVRSVAEALAMEPDCFCLCVLDGERSAQMELQLRNMGFAGEIMRIADTELLDVRAATMRLLAEQIARRGVSGDVAELGVFQGAFARLLNAAVPDRTLHLFDTFEGFDSRDTDTDRALSLSRAKQGDFADTAVEAVLELMPHPERVVVHKGWFPETFAPCEGCTFALVSLDPDLYAPTAAALPLFWERLSPGGAMVIHDYNSTQFEGVRKAVDEFCAERGLWPVPLCDMHGSAVLVKQGRE